jgi:hypothetical protein
MPVQSALGKYAHAVSAGVVLVILASWALVHVGEAFGFVATGVDTSQLDTFALAAFTYLLGNVSAINGVKPDIEAANRRLDAVGAPPAAAVDPHAPNPAGFGPSRPPEGAP